MSIVLALAIFLASPRPSFVLATTTSVENSGLLRSLSAAFERETGIEVRAIAVGSGKALRLAEVGDAQAVIAHDPAAEAVFIRKNGARIHRRFMSNDFVIVGPPADPARVRGSRSAAEAFRRIHAAGAPFVSRNDQSGTHTREMAIWKSAGIDPRTNRNYLPLGQPMGALLRSAGELRAYALTDAATFAQLQRRVGLAVMYERDPALRNIYSVILVRPRRLSSADRSAERFVQWLLSDRGRRAIEGFRIEGRQQFFWLDR